MGECTSKKYVNVDACFSNSMKSREVIVVIYFDEHITFLDDTRCNEEPNYIFFE